MISSPVAYCAGEKNLRSKLNFNLKRQRNFDKIDSKITHNTVAKTFRIEVFSIENPLSFQVKMEF